MCNLASPYYKESHRRVRDHVRRYVDEHIAPSIQEWEENGHAPDEARLRYARAGLAFPELPGEYRGGGSDLANLRTTAVKTEEGRYFVVNCHKKWITGALRATHMTNAVRTGEQGTGGIFVLVIPLHLPGISRRKMNNTGCNAGDSTWVTLENVRARICLEDAWAYAMDRQTFGKPLMAHQSIRHKLVAMARYVEIALAKVYGGRLLELANREAQQVFGGAAYQRGGVGARVEQIGRDLRVNIVGGGSEEIISDLAVRQEIWRGRGQGRQTVMGCKNGSALGWL
ncbi:Acyl-CoA dehydrogenase AFT10-1 [Colletotrichum shisoi]|uniref:Acyl-CoA dehydrogenase AFT10-1 n=1 Tax=Colletotrichum shisoi TaxID=2078593 RepID=A0A5Q4BIK8_9PEZI|nr:Acyl-CoA dehydrogenase AFT10-1 [Colletotrichum shisoi]